MTRLDLLNRVITAAALVALAVTLGVWLTRSPLTTAPAAARPRSRRPSRRRGPARADSGPATAAHCHHDRGATRSGDRPGRPDRSRPAGRQADREAGRRKRPRPQSNYQPSRRGLFRRR